MRKRTFTPYEKGLTAKKKKNNNNNRLKKKVVTVEQQYSDYGLKRSR